MIREFFYKICEKEDPDRAKQLAGLPSSCPDLVQDFVKLLRQAPAIKKERNATLEKCDYYTREVGKSCRCKVDLL